VKLANFPVVPCFRSGITLAQRATASGEIAILSIPATIWAFISGFVMESARLLLTKPSEMTVTRSLSPAPPPINPQFPF
jgi:hypothetical protein